MKIDAVSKILVAILILALFSLSAPVVAASSLTDGFAKIRDWDKTNEAFNFSAGQVTVGGGDFFIAPRGIHVFDSPGIIDMGVIDLYEIGEAPASGYVEMATPLDGHSYVVRSNGKYGKFYIDETYDWLDPVEYGIQWVYQINGTRTFEGTGSPAQPSTPGQTGTGGESGCTYEQYIAAYNKLTSLMSQGKGDTPEAKIAYEQYAKMKACYESGISGTGSPATTTTTTSASTLLRKTFYYPYPNWTPYQNGQSTVSLQQSNLCINSMNAGGAWAETTRLHDISTEYTVELDFKVTEQDNHYIIIYSDGYLHLDIDWGTALSHFQPGAPYSVRQFPGNLQLNQWYRIRMDAHPSQGTFDVYIDGSKVSTATGLTATNTSDFRSIHSMVNCTDCIFFGDPDDITFGAGKYNRGSACWRNITVIGQPKGATSQTTTTTTPIPIPIPTTALTVSGQQQLYPVADGSVYAYSYRNWNWANLGQYENMGAGWNPTGGEKRAYLRFDLPAGAGISRAVLKLYQDHRAGSGHTLGVYRVTSPWDEGTDTYHSGNVEEKAAPGELCWMQQPSFDPVPIATFSSATAVPAWAEVDITSLVQKWQSGTANYGLVVKTANDHLTKSDPEAMSGFRTKEEPQQAHRPILELSAGGMVSNVPVTTTTTVTSTPAPAGTALIAESRTAAQGNTVQVPVYFQNASNVGSLGFKLNYNPAVAQVIKVSKGSLMSPATFTSNVQTNYIIFGFAAPQDISGTGSVAIVEFKAVGGEGTKSPLTLSEILATSSSGSTVSVNALNGELSIGQKQVGDGNGDGKISVLDALLALKMYVQLLPVDLILDVNKDGRITPEDARLIVQMSKPK